MARKLIEYVDCDRCGAKNVKDAQTLVIGVDWQPDAAGGPSDEVTRSVDLCPPCLAKELHTALSTLFKNGRPHPHDRAQAWLDAGCKLPAVLGPTIRGAAGR